MERFEHGGNVHAHPGVLDFSASLNPLGIPPAARRALVEGVDGFAAYPDPDCRELTEATAAFEGVDAGMVLACAGATDAFARICQVLTPAAALVCAPCYSGYEQALQMVGARVVRHRLLKEDGFDVTEALVSALKCSPQVAFLANPNNPTGRLVPHELLVRLLAAARERGVIVVLDECFVDLTEGRGSTDLLADNPHLVIVKALTKTFALAGLRVGYVLCADQSLLGRMRKAGQPWAVSTPAQVAGSACLGDADYLQRSKALICGERERLKGELASLGLQVVPGEANFLLFEARLGLAEDLLARGVLVRPCDNFAGLGCLWYRIAVRLPEQNDVLLAALREVL